MLDLVVQKEWSDFRLDVALHVQDELVVLFGPSGSGKSLTLQSIAGLLCPDAGRIAINDRPVFDAALDLMLPPQRRRVGYVPQGYGLFPHLTVSQNIAYGIARQSRSTVKLRVTQMLGNMRLEGLAERYPRHLSGGQQQRVALARALIVEPEILLLDEPFAALDSAIRGKLRQDILDLARDFKGTTLFVTHDLAEAYMLGERIAVIDRGRVLQIGPRDEVFYRPSTRTVARFTGAKNIFSGRVIERTADQLQIAVEDGARFVVIAPPYMVDPGEHVEFCVRPDDVMLLRPDRPTSAIVRENQLRGLIVADLAQGTSYALFFKIGSATGGFRDYDLEIHVPRHTYERLNLATHREWSVSLKKRAVHVIGRTLG